MTALRYVVTVIPGPINVTVTGTEREHYAVVDNRPVCEIVENFMGKPIMETKRPPWRQIAYCKMRQHAEAIAEAMNLSDATWLEEVSRKVAKT